MIAMTISDYLLLGTAVTFAYPFVVYPSLIRLLSGRTHLAANEESEGAYTVALVICAYNEEAIIRQKIENSLRLHYAPGKLRIFLISDGSTDGTAQIAREYVNRGLNFVEHSQRRGKITNLNEVVPNLSEEMVVFSDANVMYDPDAITRLVQRFRDPSVGCISGRVALRNSATVIDGATGDYYSLEWRLQDDSSRLYSMTGADGAMYALRRELFQACPADTLIEDFVISMAIVRSGYRVVFEPSATGWEDGASTLREEFGRKIRISAGSIQGLIRGNVWPGSASGSVWFVFLSHKLFRWISPLVGIAAVVVALATIHTSALSQIVVAGVFMLFVLAALRLLLNHPHRYLDAAFYFMFSQIAMAVGLARGLMGKQSVLWAKANR